MSATQAVLVRAPVLHVIKVCWSGSCVSQHVDLCVFYAEIMKENLRILWFSRVAATEAVRMSEDVNAWDCFACFL